MFEVALQFDHATYATIEKLPKVNIPL